MLTLFPRRRMASIAKASAAALSLPTAAASARGDSVALLDLLAGFRELGRRARARGRTQPMVRTRAEKGSHLSSSCTERGPLLMSSRVAHQCRYTIEATYRSFQPPSTFRSQFGWPPDACNGAREPTSRSRFRAESARSSRIIITDDDSELFGSSAVIARALEPTCRVASYEDPRSPHWPAHPS